ncbi:sensor histidine kinase [Lysobacter xinjiangensis]|uniref:histidine kinase n=1 Tax=Cognatilysobacter xinjiangensis TaxID=546892 RepID=A0ABQ3BPW7_9GAMM|nr:ATP-binding protein [Lysobacter xinjiangensis]GGZ53021.1 sensor histidine kinase [Lysobacter xinjiangensis]
MRWAADVAPMAVLLLDAQGGVAYANASARRLGQRIDPDAPAADAPSRLLALTHEADWTIACAQGHARRDVDLRPDLVIAVEAFCGTGENAGLRFVALTDISMRSARERELQQRHDELERTYKRLAGTQEQLLQSEKMASIGQLAAGVAHEINNPIGYVHSNIGTLREYMGALFGLIDAYSTALASPDPAAHRDELLAQREKLDIEFILGDLPQLLDESREGIERVTRIVQDLKEFSHVGRNETMRPSDLVKGLESTLNIVWNDLKYKVQLEKIYGDMPLVECLPSEVNQVFMNLLINAGQAITERGVITLACGQENGEAWVSVADTGCGIPEDALGRIFDPFFTTKPIGRGTGLGLAICYRIVEKHHGRIEVQSTVGMGTTFRVVLPIRQPAVG